MKIFKNYTHQEIAQRINKSRDAAESLFYRAINALKKELKRFSNYF
jgi:DNA-directed RNA polymerase specialized sigma24 family protein